MQQPQFADMVEAILDVHAGDPGDSEIHDICDAFFLRVEELFCSMPVHLLEHAADILELLEAKSTKLPLLKPDAALLKCLERRLEYFLRHSSRLLEAQSRKITCSCTADDLDHFIQCHIHTTRLSHLGCASFKQSKTTMRQLTCLIAAAPLEVLHVRMASLCGEQIGRAS